MDIDFKDNETFIPVNQNQNQNQNHRHNIDSGSESAFNSSWSSSSSSSFLTTSFGSDLDSNEADLNEEGNGDDSDEFMAQLTRQMADYMLEENDDTKQKRTFQEATRKQNENQPRVEVVQSGGRRRKGKYHRHEQMYSGVHRPSTVAGAGSGMRAIFLGGLGSRNVGSGTGVFLPRSASDATDHTRKKPGCSTVLVPTRVLQALEQHFRYMESLSPSDKMAQTHRNRQVKKEKTQTQESDPIDRQDSKLPKEWIY